MTIESVMPSNDLILCSLLLLPSIFPRIRVFSNEAVLRIRWPKYWNFNFSIHPSNEYSGLISFRIVWFDIYFSFPIFFWSFFCLIPTGASPSTSVFDLCIRWPYSNEYSGLISFRMDWLDLLAVQGTLKGLLQHHSSKASILQHLAFFMVQHSHPYMTTGKTIALIRRTIVGKVVSLLYNMLSRLVITFLPRSKCLLISWLQSPSAVILEPKKR